MHLPAWRQSFGGVLQGDGSGEDGHGEPDHQETFGTFEGPAVSRVDVRLEVRTDVQNVILTSLNNDRTRLVRTIPELQLEETARNTREEIQTG